MNHFAHKLLVFKRRNIEGRALEFSQAHGSHIIKGEGNLEGQHEWRKYYRPEDTHVCTVDNNITR